MRNRFLKTYCDYQKEKHYLRNKNKGVELKIVEKILEKTDKNE